MGVQENTRIMSELALARQAARQAEHLVLQQALEIDRAHVTNGTLAQVPRSHHINMALHHHWHCVSMGVCQHGMHQCRCASVQHFLYCQCTTWHCISTGSASHGIGSAPALHQHCHCGHMALRPHGIAVRGHCALLALFRHSGGCVTAADRLITCNNHELPFSIDNVIPNALASTILHQAKPLCYFVIQKLQLEPC